MPTFALRGIDLRKRGDLHQERISQSRPRASWSQSSRTTLRLAVQEVNAYKAFKSPPIPGMDGVAFFAGEGSRLAQRRLRRCQTDNRCSLRSKLDSSKYDPTRPRSLLQSWRTCRRSSSSALLTAQLEKIQTSLPSNRINSPAVSRKNSSATATSSTTKLFSHTRTDIAKEAINANSFQKLKLKLRGTFTSSFVSPLQRRRKLVVEDHDQWIKVSPIRREDPGSAALRGRKKSDEFEMLLQASDTTMKISISSPLGGPLTFTASFGDDDFTLDLS